MFEEQARGLLAGGADVLWVETISAPEEFEAAALGIARTGAPWCGTMSFDTAGRTMMGLTSADMVALVAGLAHPPLAFGANCGVGASDLLRTVLGFRRARIRACRSSPRATPGSRSSSTGTSTTTARRS